MSHLFFLLALAFARARQEDEELQQEFDELMRSGTTMKVSLTPDRLKSMEVRDRSHAALPVQRPHAVRLLPRCTSRSASSATAFPAARVSLRRAKTAGFMSPPRPSRPR